MKTKILKALKSSKFVLFFVALWNKILISLMNIWHKIVAKKGYPKIVYNKIIGSEYFKVLVKDYKNAFLQPFIIIIENTGVEILKDVEILNAIKRFKLNFNVGWEGIPELKISYGIPGVSYEEFITNLLSYKYVINKIRLSYSNETVTIYPMEDFQMTLVGREINGNTYSEPMLTLLDKNQYAQTIVDIEKVFKIDCFTSITIQQIPPHTKVRIYLYPTLRY